MSCCTPTNPSWRFRGCPARGPAARRLSGLEAQHFRLPRAGVHTALETCGLADWETFRELVPPAPAICFLYDIKHMDRPTGGSRARAAGGLCDNLHALFRMGKKVLIRMPLLPVPERRSPPGLEAAFAMLREEAAQGADIAGVELLP